jgi:hypothetical protein
MGLFSGISLSSIVGQGVQQGILNASSVSPGPVSTIGLKQSPKQTITAVTAAKSSGELAALSPGPASRKISGEGVGEYTVYRYPNNLQGNSQEDPPHAVLFYVNVPVTSSYKTDTSQIVQNNSVYYGGVGGTTNPQNNTTNADGEVPEVVTTGQGFATKGIAVQQNSQFTGGTLNSTQLSSLLQPSLSRISTAIALYMPDTITAAYNHNWNPVSLFDALGNFGQSAITALGAVEAAKDLANRFTGAYKPSPVNTTPIERTAFTNITNATLGTQGTGVLENSAGYALNPQIEMLYRGTDNREFTFEFRFQPRSSDESVAIMNIINTFKMYAAPELISQVGGSVYGRYFIPPAQFDIQFAFTSGNNPYLPTISTCVLQNISVNYSKAGHFATFTDGMPVEIGLTLIFKEVDIMYRQLIQKYGY